MKNKPEINQIPLTSPDERETRIQSLRQLFPDLFDGEGVLDEKALRALMDEVAPNGNERFRFEWAGKQQSKRFAFAPSKATLIFDATKSINVDGSSPTKDDPAEASTSGNLFIEGDNLEVLKLLSKSYFEQVKCIYIDPPYNTGKDFIYQDDFSQTTSAYWEQTGVKRGGVRLVALPETHGKRHSVWLNMMQSRLYAARQVLKDDGLIIVSIDDNEVANLRRLMDEVFGDTNFIAQITIQSNKRGQTYKDIAKTHEYLVVYAKSDDFEIYEFEKEEGGLPYKDADGNYDLWGLRNRNPKFNSKNRANLFYPIWVSPKLLDSDGFHRVSTVKTDEYCDQVLPLNSEDGEGVWRWSTDLVNKNIGNTIPTIVAKKKLNGEWSIFQKSRRDTTKAKTIWYETDIISEKGTVQLGQLSMAEYFEHPKPIGLIKRIIDLTCDNGDIILDFFAGSGTTAHAVMEYNKETGKSVRFIVVQVPEITPEKSNARAAGYETISALTVERIKRAGSALRGTLEGKSTDLGFRAFYLSKSNFPENAFTPYPEKSEADNMRALDEHLLAASQKTIFADETLSAVVTEIALKFGFGLFFQTVSMTSEYPHNNVLTITGNGKSAILCLDSELKEATVEALKTHSEEQLIVAKSALDTTKKFELHNSFNDNLWSV